MELAIDRKVVFDSRIIEREYHAHLPYGSNKLGPSDEARFVIQHQDLITATYDSFIYMEAKIIADDPAKAFELTSNAVAFLFDEISFELGDQTIETVRNPGITTTLKGLASLNPLESKELEVSGWSPTSSSLTIVKTNDAGTAPISFSAILPLKFVLGFAEDYQKVIANMRQTLILRRSRTDLNCYKGEADIKIDIEKIEWRVPYLKLSDAEKLKWLRILEKDGPVQIGFRKWDLYTVPSLRASKLEVLNLATKTPLRKPRQSIIGLQTSKVNDKSKDCSIFEHLNIVNATVYLNEKAYPYSKWNLNIANNGYLLAYKNFCDFQNWYYKRTPQPALSYKEFKKNPIFVINCSHQQDDVKSGTVDVKVELESSEPFPANTYAYILLLHDALVSYRPLTNVVVNHQI